MKPVSLYLATEGSLSLRAYHPVSICSILVASHLNEDILYLVEDEVEGAVGETVFDAVVELLS